MRGDIGFDRGGAEIDDDVSLFWAWNGLIYRIDRTRIRVWYKAYEDDMKPA